MTSPQLWECPGTCPGCQRGGTRDSALQDMHVARSCPASSGRPTAQPASGWQPKGGLWDAPRRPHSSHLWLGDPDAFSTCLSSARTTPTALAFGVPAPPWAQLTPAAMLPLDPSHRPQPGRAPVQLIQNTLLAPRPTKRPGPSLSFLSKGPPVFFARTCSPPPGRTPNGFLYFNILF